MQLGIVSSGYPQFASRMLFDVLPIWGELPMAIVKSDIEIARSAAKKPVLEIGAKIGIPPEHLAPYGYDKAKLSAEFIRSKRDARDGKLILVTAVSPTPAGEGKTTTTVGLGDGLNRIGKKAIVCIREAWLGPCFGEKGRSCRRRLCAGDPDGRHQPAFHRRLPRCRLLRIICWRR